MGGSIEHVAGAPAGRPQVDNSRIPIRFAEFVRGRLHDERMVGETRRRRPSQKPRQSNLEFGRRGEIAPTNHQIDALMEVVNRHRELIRPVALPVPYYGIASSSRHAGDLRGQQQISCRVAGDRVCQPHAPGHAITERDGSIPARPWIPQGRRFVPRGLVEPYAARADAPVEQASMGQFTRRCFVDGGAIALAGLARPRTKRVRRILVGPEAQPIQVGEELGFVLRPRSLSVVILDAQQDVRTVRAPESPDVDGADDVAQMEQARGSRCETGQGHGWVEDLKREDVEAQGLGDMDARVLTIFSVRGATPTTLR